jgi:hypothetical protein
MATSSNLGQRSAPVTDRRDAPPAEGHMAASLYEKAKATQAKDSGSRRHAGRTDRHGSQTDMHACELPRLRATPHSR